MTTMYCTVLEAREGWLLCCNHDSNQSVIVHTDLASCFCTGDRLCIEYSGAMTMSLPPQMSATRITRICCTR